jgi:hypothetical protein
MNISYFLNEFQPGAPARESRDRAHDVEFRAKGGRVRELRAGWRREAGMRR